MIGAPPPVTDEDLHGLVDGELEPRRRDFVLRFLASSPADAARVESWRRQNETIRAAFARVETEAPPDSLLLAPPESEKRFSCKIISEPGRFSGGGKTERDPAPQARGRLRQFLLLLAAFFGGIIFALSAALIVDHLDGPEPPRLTVEHPPARGESDAIFIGRTVAALQSLSPATASPAQGGGLGKGETALVLPNFAETGLRLIGARAAPSEFDRMYCFFYAKQAEATVVLCAEKINDATASAFHQVGRFPGGAIDWRQMGARYAIAGPLSDKDLRSLAERARAEIEAFDGR
ncbi:anti-sigma factor family protein [Methylocapsa acidiphila]|uniref:anti-sigma factor family protein n=1 Tax=Methylocapsa acidiphila TaxID=133552 RepID=UPI00047B8584|nr:hypothetical protein [Methylocapsa acidiphila]